MKKFIFLLIFFSLTSLILSDEVILLDKNIVKGHILSQDENNVYLEINGENKSIPLNEVGFVRYQELENLNYKAKEIYMLRRFQIDSDDIKSHIELINFCIENNLFEEARKDIINLSSKLPNQNLDINNWLKKIDINHANYLLTKGHWWINKAANLNNASNLFESIIIKYPHLKEANIARNELEKIAKKEKQLKFFHEIIDPEKTDKINNFEVFISKNIKEKNFHSSIAEASEIVSLLLDIKKPLNTIQIYIFKDKIEYQKASNTYDWSGGSSITKIGHGAKSFLKIINQKIYLIKNSNFEEALTHELAHVYLKHKLPLNLKLPIWFEEGICIYIGKLTSRRKNLSFKHKTNNSIALKLLFSFEDYPSFESIFYHQSASIIQFLLENFKLHATLQFAYLLSRGYSFDKAIFDTFSPDIDNLSELEHMWIEWVQKNN